jgi:hypothetical protein
LGVLDGLKTRVQLAQLLMEEGELLPTAAGIEVAEGTIGLAVETLARESALPGIAGDGAASSEEDGAGTGESFERRYDTHG